MSDAVRAHLWVSGRVQGIFYRATCQEVAQRLNLCGWVRNAPDGRVEAVAEGPKASVEQLVAWCRRGPPGARVTGVDVTWETPEGEERFGVTF